LGDPPLLSLAMKRKSPRTRLLAEARLDAIAYVQEFRRRVGPEGTDWVQEAWADLRRHLRLTAEQAARFWPAYWMAFSAETVRLAAIHRADK
jgi:hypothetical protein